MFPTRVSLYGGGSFLIPYFIFVILIGSTGVIGEMSFGRAAKAGPIDAFGIACEKKGKRKVGEALGMIPVFGSLAMAIGYTVVMGWILRYAVGTFTGATLSPENVDEFGAAFGKMASAFGNNIWQILALVACMLILMLGVGSGIEKANKIMMPILFLLFVGLGIYVATLPGASDGYRYIFTIKPAGLLDPYVWIYAFGQAFFSLSVGMGGMAIFGSYIGKDRALMGESVHVILLDTFVAVLAGIIIFPACFTYGLEVTAGPSLLFDTMAGVFNHMAGGRWWGTLFFLFMVFAALSTVLGVCENILAMIRELTGWSRPKGCLVCGVGIFLLALTTALGYSVLHFQPFAPGSAWLDFWDFIVSNNVLPLLSLIHISEPTRRS